MAENIIKLNVGGVHYDTTLRTLTESFSFGDANYFGVLLNTQVPALKDDQGRYFIDRDGNLFRYVLQFLRTAHVHVNEIQLVEELLVEADFYQVIPMTRHLNEIKKSLQSHALKVFKIGFTETRKGWTTCYSVSFNTDILRLYDDSQLPEKVVRYINHCSNLEGDLIMMILREGYQIVHKYESTLTDKYENYHEERYIPGNMTKSYQRVVRYYIFSNNSPMLSEDQ